MLSRRVFASLLIASMVALSASAPPATQSAAQAKHTLKLDCGYDPAGAEDGWYAHQLNARRFARDGFDLQVASGPRVYEVGDVAVIEDDSTIVMPPRKFDLKNKSITFTPDGAGYRVERGGAQFDTNYGTKVTGFIGITGALTENNGYREVALQGQQFTFFGEIYDRVFVGTNGYVTFDVGDTTSRPSPSTLASESPRIAPLWADLDATSKGSIFYNRLADRHLITWKGVGQVIYSGASTFQAALYDDGRIVFAYKKVKARSSLVGVSPGSAGLRSELIDFSDPPSTAFSGPAFESFSSQKQLDHPGLTRAFYEYFGDEFDTLYVWTDFEFDNGLGYAHAFNLRNSIRGIGQAIFDRGAIYGSPERLSSLLVMGNIVDDWPDDPNSHVVGLNSAISIVCHEQGHRWLSFVRFREGGEVKDDLLGRGREHWSFLLDTRTNQQGSFSSLMEGNSWRQSGVFTTVETAVNHFSPLDLYLIGLVAAEDVGTISYLETDEELQDLIRSRSPVQGFSMTARRKDISINNIIRQEGEREPDFSSSQKEFRVAFVLVVERGDQPSQSTIERVDRYRRAQERYFSLSTGRRASLDSSLAGARR
jgi:hypothetical protein